MLAKLKKSMQRVYSNWSWMPSTHSEELCSPWGRHNVSCDIHTIILKIHHTFIAIYTVQTEKLKELVS